MTTHRCHADGHGPCVAEHCPIAELGPLKVRGRAFLRPCPPTHEVPADE